MTDEMDIDDLADVIGNFDKADESDVGQNKDFKPWHHPRKQWVRAKQWCKHTEKLIGKLKKNGLETLSYLTLPGDDLLDVREIHRTCSKNGFKLKYLGFNTATQMLNDDPLSINHYEMTSKEDVNNQSHIERERLELIAKENSMANKAFESRGPFDVVNIDLCNSVAIHSNRPSDVSYFDMLLKLLNSQFEKKSDPWVLFISSTVSVPEINKKVVEGFIAITKKNIDSSLDFKNELLRSLNKKEEELTGTLEAAFGNDSEEMISLFGISLCKWLLSICVDAQPHWTLTVEDVCCYAVQDEKSTMISLALKFEKCSTVRKDSTGLAKNNDSENELVDEAKLAVEALRTISGRLNLDSYLKENQDIFENMKRASVNLLEEAKYPIETYDTWLSSKA